MSILNETLVAPSADRTSLRQFWWRHALVPLLAFVLLAGMLAFTRADDAIAKVLFFDASRMRWIGANNWWVNDLVHVGGRWFMRANVLAGLALCLAARFRPGLIRWRRPATYFVVAVVLSVGVVGLMKTITNVDCPWDLTEFGGRFPVVALFSHRPTGLRLAHCFPAAHAASGYALFALYFLFRERSVTLARLGFVTGIVTGVIFGIAQQSRGAHFISHDMWSALLTWINSLTVYTWIFKARLWEPLEVHADPDVQEQDGLR